MRRRIRGAWVEFEARVMPRNAPRVQRVEMRRSFYAGAIVCLSTIVEMLDPGSEPTEADLAKMDELKAEIDEYMAEISAEAAASEGSLS